MATSDNAITDEPLNNVSLRVSSDAQADTFTNYIAKLGISTLLTEYDVTFTQVIASGFSSGGTAPVLNAGLTIMVKDNRTDRFTLIGLIMTSLDNKEGWQKIKNSSEEAFPFSKITESQASLKDFHSNPLGTFSVLPCKQHL